MAKVKFYTMEELLRTAHPDEPFPLYRPQTKKDKRHFRKVKLKWALKKHFVKTKSPLSDKPGWEWSIADILRYRAKKGGGK